jgi:hypothetical protein
MDEATGLRAQANNRSLDGIRGFFTAFVGHFDHLVIVGDSGTGETIAILLARCSMEEFILCGKDTYGQADTSRRSVGARERGKSRYPGLVVSSGIIET